MRQFLILVWLLLASGAAVSPALASECGLITACPPPPVTPPSIILPVSLGCGGWTGDSDYVHPNSHCWLYFVPRYGKPVRVPLVLDAAPTATPPPSLNACDRITLSTERVVALTISMRLAICREDGVCSPLLNTAQRGTGGCAAYQGVKWSE